MDPWYDYLALPIGPLMLLIQFVTLLLPWRRVAGLAITAGLAIMFLFVLGLSGPEEGANIGAALLLIQLIGSVGMLALAYGLPGRNQKG